MTICESIFQKKLYDLTVADLEAFFAEPQEENAILEFKEGSTDVQKLHKEVAAFLNTEGGLLIYGAPRELEHPQKKGYKVAQGALTGSKIRDRDVIMRSLGTGISPAPSGIKIQALEVADGTVYVLEIPQSMTPPHQEAAKGAYYLRLEREAKPAPHGLVAAMFNKRQRPVLGLLTKTQAFGKDAIKLTIQVVNLSPVTAYDLGYLLELNGVKQLLSAAPNDRSTLSDELVSSSHVDKGSIYVRGISMKLELTFVPLYSNFYLRFSYFARDLDLQRSHEIWDLNGNQLYLSDLSDINEEEDPKPETDFENLRHKSLTDKLQFSANFREQLPFDEENCNSWIQQSGSYLPQSYIRFLRHSNGFEGMIGRHQIQFYPYKKDDLPGERTLKFFGKDYLIIGCIDNSMLGYQLQNNQQIFGVFESGGAIFRKISGSFYDFVCHIFYSTGVFDKFNNVSSL